jgi:DNA anti-recombination protein RmuC
METLYFTLGIASVVVAAVAVGAMWAMFKVAKLNSMLRDVEQQFGSTHRDIEMVNETIHNQMNNNMRDLDERFKEVSRTCDELHDIIDSRVNEIYRTIDSRVDKLAAKQEKQLLKG